MNVENEEWVQHALMDFERKHCISKVLSIECQNAVPKGNNYGSDMYRFNMKVVLHSGEVVARSVIYKAVPTTTARNKFIKGYNLHKKESQMLTEVFPEMERIRQEKEFGVERISPRCYGVRRGHEGLLLEDLTEIGYKMVDRFKLLDFKHAELVLSTYAQFHALSRILVEHGDLTIDDYKDCFFHYHSEEMGACIMPALTNMTAEIEGKWGPEWKVYAEKLREFTKTAMSKYKEETKFNEANFNVLTHGDCWLANMMFRYDSNGCPQNVRLLDFQLSNFNNVGLDLQYFLNTSLNAETRERKPELLQLYYNKLISSLALYGYSGELPSFEYLMECYNRASSFGLTNALTFVPMIMQPTESIPDDLEKWVEDLQSEKGVIPPNIESDGVRPLLEILLKHGNSIGLL